MSVPQQIRDEVYAVVVRKADELGWQGLAPASRTRYYDAWTKEPDIGGRLVRFLEANQVRHYIKDALIKQYARERRDNAESVLLQAGIRAKPISRQKRPHGCRLRDGRMYVWGRANNWKILLLALHERVYVDPAARTAGVVLTQSARHFASHAERAVVEDAAKRLGVERVVWLLE